MDRTDMGSGLSGLVMPDPCIKYLVCASNLVHYKENNCKHLARAWSGNPTRL